MWMMDWRYTGIGKDVPSPTTFLASQQLVIDTGGEILGQGFLRVDEKGVVQCRRGGGLGGGGRSGRRRTSRHSRLRVRHGRKRDGREGGREAEGEQEWRTRMEE